MVMGDLPESTDILVIGGGPGGYVAALRAAALGKNVTLASDGKLGGICLHYGCIPSKTLIHAANFLEDAKHSEEMGITTKTKLDLKKLRSWKQGVLDKLEGGINALCKARKVNVIKGKAEFETPNRAVVQTENGRKSIEFTKAIIATGSKATEIQGFPFSHKRVWNARKALEVAEVPGKLAVIGAGYIGLELGVMYAKLGSKVTMLEAGSEFMPKAEPETRKAVQKRLAELGIELMLGSKAEGFTERNKTLKVKTDAKELEADYVLVAVGMKPYTEGLKLENATLSTDERGFIVTNDSMQTRLPHVYAVGDVRAGPFLAHKAYAEGKVAAEHACGLNSVFQAQVIPSVIFCDPEIASVGMTEKEATEKELNVKSAKFSFHASGRAQSMNSPEGFIKVVADEKNVIHGIEIVGRGASELIGEAVLAIEMGATAEDIALSIHAHPTLSESLMEATENFLGKGVHSYSK